jgi:hypothetical protein
LVLATREAGNVTGHITDPYETFTCAVGISLQGGHSFNAG